MKKTEQQTVVPTNTKRAYLVTFTALIGLNEFDNTKKYRRSTSIGYESELTGIDFITRLRSDCVKYARNYFMTESARENLKVLTLENLKFYLAPLLLVLFMIPIHAQKSCQRMYDRTNSEYAVSIDNQSISVYQLKTQAPLVIQHEDMYRSTTGLESNDCTVLSNWKNNMVETLAVINNGSILYLYAYRQRPLQYDTTGNIPTRN